MSKTTVRKVRVWDGDRILEGTARDILEKIRSAAAAKNAEIRGMNVDEYAQSLIEDAPYFISEDFLSQLQRHEFDSAYEKALACLAAGSTQIHVLP